MGQELRRSFMEKFGQSTVDISRCSLRVRTPICGIGCGPMVSLGGGQQRKSHMLTTHLDRRRVLFPRQRASKPMFSLLNAPDEQDEPSSHSRTVLYGPKAFTGGNRAYV
jgi:hypothetical protein